MKFANDVCLRTTEPLPVAYELNEPSGSQDRKHKHKDRRKCAHKQSPWRDKGTSCCMDTFVPHYWKEG